MSVITRPEELIQSLEKLAGEMVGGEARFLPYDWPQGCLRVGATTVRLDNKTVAGECALNCVPVNGDGHRPVFGEETWKLALALPVSRFGSLAGVLVVSGEPSAAQRTDLAELAESYALLAHPIGELDRARLSVSRLEELTTAAVEGLPWVANGHVGAVCQLSADLAEFLDMSAQERRRLWNAALYHDVGKVLLQRRSEVDEASAHAQAGADFLGFQPALAELVATHHERYDGSGPLRKTGPELGLAHWVLALAEDFEEFRAEHSHLGFEAQVDAFFHNKARGHHPLVLDALAGLIDSGRLGSVARGHAEADRVEVGLA